MKKRVIRAFVMAIVFTCYYTFLSKSLGTGVWSVILMLLLCVVFDYIAVQIMNIKPLKKYFHDIKDTGSD